MLLIWVLYDCYSLVSLNLNNFITSNVINMGYMFYGCNSFKSLYLNSFITSNVTNMEYMFYGCNSLTSLNLSNFDVSNVINMTNMFKDCNSLKSLNINNFNASKVISMISMFEGCNSLLNLELKSINIKNAKYMQSIFNGCSSLVYLDLSRLDTSNVVNMENMFSNCYSLNKLNLNINTSNVINMKQMFSGCSSLRSLNISNFDTSKVIYMEEMFMSCSSLISLDLSNFNIKKVIYFSKMFYGCKNLEFLNISKFKILDQKDIQMPHYINANYEQMFTQIPENIVYCIDENNTINYDPLMLNPLKYRRCSVLYCQSDWKSKKKKFVVEENICLENCFDDLIYKYHYEDKCYRKCPSGSHELATNKYECEKDLISCNENENFTYFNLETNECVKACKLSEFFNKKCISTTDSLKVKLNNIYNIINEIENSVNDLFIKNNIIENKDERVIRENNLIYQITSSYTENKKYFGGNISIIKLGECENILKEYNNLEKNDTLIIFKYEFLIPELLIPYIGFEVFHPYTKKKLDITICERIATINYYIPVNIREDKLYIYNKSDDFYKDRCLQETTENGTDLILYDKKNEYNNNYLALCLKGCDFIQYNSTTKNAICKCFIENMSRWVDLDSIIDKKKLLNRYKDDI